MRTTFALVPILAATLFLGLVPHAVRAQEEGDEASRLKRRLERYVGRLGTQDTTEFWNIVLQIEALGEPVVPLIRAELAKADLAEPAKLGLAKAMASLEAFDEALVAMMELAEKSENRALRLSAIEMLGSFGDDDLEEKLAKLLKDTFDPPLQIALAKALFQACGSTTGTMTLKGLLKSDDVRIQYDAALALAELGDIDSARLVLTTLEREPTDRGRLAHSYLRQEATLKRMEKMLLGGQPVKPVPGRTESDLLEELIALIQKYHVDGDKFDRARLVALAAKGMASGLDLHSVYWTGAEWKDFLKQITGDYAGIGAYVGIRGGYFTIIAPIYSGPAYKAGLRSRDRIVEVEGWKTYQQPTDEVIKRIQGTPGTSVKLKVYRDGWEDAREWTVVRQQIAVKSVAADRLAGDIGYFRISQFGPDTDKELAAAIKAMVGETDPKPLKGLIIDLRDNGGGYMQIAKKFADLFLTEGKLIVYSEGRSELGKRQDLFSSAETLYPTGELVLLIDGGSASASEIVAGALKHHGRATLVGQRSFGKGTVQQPLQLDTDKEARLKLTIARYYLPDGKSIDTLYDAAGKLIHRGGIAPDVAVAPRRLEGWKNEEFAKLWDKRALRDYVDKLYPDNKALFAELAVDDHRETTRYPGFDAWFASLGTKADKHDVREWVRSLVREKVADERGAEFVHDLLEDRQLQRAVLVMCEKLKVDPKAFDAFKPFADAFPAGAKEPEDH